MVLFLVGLAYECASLLGNLCMAPAWPVYQNNYVQETQQQPNMLSQSSVNMHSQILPNTIQAPQQSMPTLQQMGSPSTCLPLL